MEIVDKAVDEMLQVLLNHELEAEMVARVYKAFRELCHMQKIGMQYLNLYLN